MRFGVQRGAIGGLGLYLYFSTLRACIIGKGIKLTPVADLSTWDLMLLRYDTFVNIYTKCLQGSTMPREVKVVVEYCMQLHHSNSGAMPTQTTLCRAAKKSTKSPGVLDLTLCSTIIVQGMRTWRVINEPSCQTTSSLAETNSVLLSEGVTKMPTKRTARHGSRDRKERSTGEQQN